MKSNSDAANAKKKKQQVVVALLLVGLLIAVVTQPEDSASKPKVSNDLKVTNVKLTKGSKKSKGKKFSQDLTSIVVLPEVDMDDIVTTDLFAVREKPDEEQEADVKASEQRQLTIQAIYGADNGEMTALVNNQLVRAGQTLPDGRKVLRVTASGIELQK